MSQSYHKTLLPKNFNFKVYCKLEAKNLFNKIKVFEHVECSSLKLKTIRNCRKTGKGAQCPLINSLPIELKRGQSSMKIRSINDADRSEYTYNIS